MKSVASGKLGAALLALAALYFAAFLTKGALDEAPAVAEPQSDGFDAARAVARLARILGDQRAHPVDSEANDAVRARLLSDIAALGYAPDVRDDFSCRGDERWRGMACARVRNVVFRAGPAGGDAVLVAAHYDSVPAGPGAGDDGLGVATALEIAHVLRTRTLSRPVIFMLTDGEEAGLLGAASFVRKDPLAKTVAAVVNLEARGVSGRALMFETSAPNARAVEAYARAPRPAANSLATAIYKMMPNDTDMTEFLSLGADAANFAIIGRPQFYHTPRDDLGHLDRRSLAHVGASALATVEGFLNPAPRAEPHDLAFTDLGGRWFLVFSVLLGQAALGFAVLVGVVVFFRVGGGSPLRAFLAPPVGAALAGAAAFGLSALIGAVRGGDLFWWAYPWATQAVIYAAAIGGVLCALILMGQCARRERLLAAAWIWFGALGCAAAAVAPGAVGVFAPPAAVFLVAALASLAAPRLFLWLGLLAALAALLVLAPLLDLAEGGLSLRFGAPFAVLGALLFGLAAPAALPDGGVRRKSLIAPLVTLTASVLAALVVPSASPTSPSPANIVHDVDAASGVARFVLQGPPPLRWADRAATFRRENLAEFGEVPVADAPSHDGVAARIEVLSSAPTSADGKRRVRVRVTADGADRVRVTIPAEAGLKSLSAGGSTTLFRSPHPSTLSCSGRGCASFEFEATMDAAPAEWRIVAIRFGLDAAGQTLKAARPPEAIAIQNGDVRQVRSAVTI